MQNFKKAGNFWSEKIHWEILLHTCVHIYFKYIHAYIHTIYIHIKEICEKQGIIQNWNQSLLRLRKAFHLNWLFLSCPVLLSHLKQATLMVERDHFSCVPVPKGFKQKASSQTPRQELAMLQSSCFRCHSLWRRTYRPAAYNSQNPRHYWPDHSNNHRWIAWLGLERIL